MAVDFLETEGREFDNLDQLTEFIKQEVDLSDLNGKLSLIGSVSDFDDKQQLLDSLRKSFEILEDRGNLTLMEPKEGSESYYMFYIEDFPVFLTTANKQGGRNQRGDEISNTLFEHMMFEKNLGRLWISQDDMEEIRKKITAENPEVLMPYFAAKRSDHTEIDAQKRPSYSRTFQYTGDDGVKTFEELKYEYGVLPTNIVFEKPNYFKFRVSNEGVFTITRGGLDESLYLIKESIKKLRSVKEVIDSSSFSLEESKYSEDEKIPSSKPWAIEIQKGLDEADVKNIPENIEGSYWEFSVSNFTSEFGEDPYFSALLIDDNNFGKIAIRSKEDSIRIYPREETGIDEAMRFFHFVNNQIDSSARPTTV